MPPVFRELPPIELVEDCVKAIGLKDLTDFSWFSKSQISVETFEELLPFLEPYYLPCKAKDYLYKSPFTQSSVITVLRQLLKVYDITLKSCEKSQASVKTTLYQLDTKKFSLNKSLPSEITVDFS